MPAMKKGVEEKLILDAVEEWSEQKIQFQHIWILIIPIEISAQPAPAEISGDVPKILLFGLPPAVDSQRQQQKKPTKINCINILPTINIKIP